MSITVRKATAALLATGLFAFSGAAMATNGYFTHGVGTESKGMAGSGVGSPENLGGISRTKNGRSVCRFSAPCAPTRRLTALSRVRVAHSH